MSLRSYLSLRGKHQNETAFIIGSGTSVAGIDLSPIHDNIVITVNAGILLMPWDEAGKKERYWVSNDALCRRWDWWSRVKAAKAEKVVRDSWKNYFNEIPDFYVFSPRPTAEDIINPNDQGLCYCSSIPSSIDLALQMGCKKIFILGVDQYFRGKKSHFWQLWPKDKQPKRIDRKMAPHSQQEWTFGYNNKAYSALRKFADYLGAKIYNCNPVSKVESFEKISYNQALEII